MMLTDGENVLIRDDEADFADAVLRLYDDKQLWDRLSAASLSYIDNGYSVQRGIARVREIINVISNNEDPNGARDRL
jgi:glycosyltransferase involved in cell wall biosynthesis